MAALSWFAYVSISDDDDPSSDGPTAGGPVAGTGDTSSAAAPAKPQPGAYKFRLAHSNLCLNERPHDQAGLVYQADCAQTMPNRSLWQERDGNYRIAADHPDFGLGCAGLPANKPQPETQVSDTYCGAADVAEFFQIESVATPVPGYRLRAVYSGLCLGAQHGSAQPWVPIVQLTCDPAAVSQIFLLDPLGQELYRAPPA